MQTFKFAPGLELRVIDRDGDPWFIAKDVCEALGMDTSKKGTGPFIAHLDADQISDANTLGSTGGKQRGNPTRKIVSESGLYALILKSRKAEARAFQRWVTDDVLPAIRKTGGYMAPSVASLAEENPQEFLARALLIADQTMNKLRVQAKGLESAEESGPLVVVKEKHGAVSSHPVV